MITDELELYLPKYLSADSENALRKALKDFPVVSPDRYYTQSLLDNHILYQGDGIKDLIIINLPSTDIKNKESIILSNSCDNNPENERFFSSHIIYSPIIKLADYESILESEGKTKLQIESHFKTLKSQEISQIFYLPSYGQIMPDSLVFLDKLQNLPNSYIERNQLESRRIFSLSNFGFYLFLIKISFHFTRIQEGVDRN